MSTPHPYALTDDELLIVKAAAKVTVATVTGTGLLAMMLLAQIMHPAGSEKADFVWDLYRAVCDAELERLTEEDEPIH